MKVVFTFLFFLLLHGLFAQDVITKNDGIEIKAKVLEIGIENVKYTKFGTDSGRVYIIAQADIFMIKYEDGTTDLFNDSVTDDIIIPGDDYVQTEEPLKKAASFSSGSSYENGKADAKIYYKGHKTAGTVTLISTILFVPIGLIPAISTTSTEPSDKNLMYPNGDLMRNDLDYARGYKAGAKKVKSKKVWNNFLIGFGTAILIGIVFSGGS